MKGQRSDIWWLIRSGPGRLEIKRRYGTKMWTAASRFSRVYRRTLGRRVRIIAVIGSVGKTTTMRAISAALDVPVSKQQLLNANSRTSIGRQVLGLRPWRRTAVLEVAIGHVGDMLIHARTVLPNVVVVTAIARDHWQSMGTLEKTRDEKADMLRVLPANGIAILNADDENVRWMATQTKARVVYIGQAADAEVRASEVEMDWPHGMRFVAHVGGDSYSVATQLMGEHMVFPALAAIAVAHVEGVPIPRAIKALEKLTPTPGRMQIMPTTNGAYVLRDDFKSTQDPVEAALKTFAQVPGKRHFVVLGEMTEELGQFVYRDLGQVVGGFADRAVFVGSKKNFRTFRAGTKLSGMSPEVVSQVRTAHEATELLRGELEAGDVALINGRWQQALGRVGLALAGRDVKCRADPCPFKRMLCDMCPFLEQEFHGLPGHSAAASDR